MVWRRRKCCCFPLLICSGQNKNHKNLHSKRLFWPYYHFLVLSFQVCPLTFGLWGLRRSKPSPAPHGMLRYPACTAAAAVHAGPAPWRRGQQERASASAWVALPQVRAPTHSTLRWGFKLANTDVAVCVCVCLLFPSIFLRNPHLCYLYPPLPFFMSFFTSKKVTFANHLGKICGSFNTNFSLLLGDIKTLGQKSAPRSKLIGDSI